MQAKSKGNGGQPKAKASELKEPPVRKSVKGGTDSGETYDWGKKTSASASKKGE